IGNTGVAGESSTIRIGTTGVHTSTFIAGILGQPVAGSAVFVNSAGQLGTVPSSERFKDNIRPMGKLSEALFALEPVTFHYKKELDAVGGSQFGLVAEEVEKVNPDLVVRDQEGKPYSVRYEAVNAMLLNEFLKEHRAFLKEQRKVEVQEKTIAELKSGMTALAAMVKQQATQIQKVSGQFAAASPSGGGPAPQARAVCQQGCELGLQNTFLGDDALLNTIHGNNTAIGFKALFNNTTGNGNTADGSSALVSNTTGNENTANGSFSLASNTTGWNNIAVGFHAGFNLTTGRNNIALGAFAGADLTTGNNNIDIGNTGVAGESKTIRIGTTGVHRLTFIAGILGQPVAGS